MLSSNPRTVADFLKELVRMVDDEGNRYHVQRVRTWVKNWAFYRGSHYGGFDRVGNWVNLPDNQTEDLRYTDDFAFFVEAKATQWSKSEPELSIKPVCDDAPTKGAVRHIEKELIRYRKSHWTDSFQQSMAKFAMLSTCYFVQTRPKVSEKTDKYPKFSSKLVKSSQMWMCAGCGEAGNDDEDEAMENCPGCGNPVSKMPVSNGQISVSDELEEAPIVEVITELVDPMEVKIDPKCRGAKVSMADWIRRERYIRRYELDAMYPDWDKGKDYASEPSTRSDVLDYKRTLEQGVGGFTYEQKNDSNVLLRRQYWFDCSVYKTFKITSDEEFADTKFTKGKTLYDYFPKGLYIDQINGKFLKLFSECKNSTWVGGVDTIDPTSPYGRGFSGLVNLQEMLDEGVSLGFAYMMRDALGLQVYDPMMVESSDVASTRVGGAIPLKPGAQMEGRPITAALINVENKPLSPFTIPFLQLIDSKMPHAAGGAYDVLGGGGGVGAGAKTLGGQEQQLQTSTGMIGPALQIRAKTEVDCFYQYLEHIQKYGSQNHYNTVAGEWGMGDAAAFLKCDIREDINIFSVPNSEIPRTQMEKRADVAIAIQSGLANPQAPIAAGVRRYGLEQLRMPVDEDPEAQTKRVGEALLERMRQAAKYVSSIPNSGDSTQLATAIASVAELTKQRDGDSLVIMKGIFQSALKSLTEDPDADPDFESALMMKLDEIEQMDVGVAKDASAKAALIQAPMAQAQAQMEQANQPPPEDAGAAAQAQAEAQKGQATHEANLESTQSMLDSQLQDNQQQQTDSESDKQREHEASEADKQRRHDLQLARIQKTKENSQKQKSKPRK
jgi:hypothetical protein